MWTRRISRGSPERMYLTVRNCGSTTVQVGSGAFFAFHSTTYNDGYNVCLNDATAITQWQLAGVCARYPIAPGGNGVVIAFGQVDSIYVTGFATNYTNWAAICSKILIAYTPIPGYFTIATAGSLAADALCCLRPTETKIIGDTTGGVSTSGYVRGFIRAL
jgi:hypothetical protein